MTAPATELADFDLDADVVCARKKCDAKAAWQLRLHLRNSKGSDTCRTGTIFLCDKHKEQLLRRAHRLRKPETCACGKLIAQPGDFILWVRPL